MKCIKPDYIKKFVCDGRACGSRCCRDWRIVIDDAAYEKFSELSTADREEILENTMWTDDEREGGELLTIKLRSDGTCSFLGDDLLCNLQKKHGEDFLAAICQSYPRVTYKLSEEVFEQSLTLTCPVAARLILFSDEPLTFFETSEIKERFMISFKRELPRPVDDIIEVQMSAIKILQDRTLPINRRMKNLCELFFDQALPNINFDPKRHSETLVKIFTKTYNANFNESKSVELGRRYILNRDYILSSVYKTFENVIENYLVNEFFMRCYPCAFTGSEWYNCKVFVTGFKLLEFAIVMTVIARKSLTPEDLAVMIYSVNDMLDHSRGGMDAILEFAETCNVDDFVSLMLE